MFCRTTLVLALLCCIGASFANAMKGDLPISFEADEEQSTLLRVSLQNPSETDTLVVVPFHSPLLMDSSLSFDVLDIETQSSLSYTGALYSRIWPPSSLDIISIPPGESHSTFVDLRTGFDLEVGHSYAVHPHLAATVSGVFIRSDEHQKRSAESSLSELFTSFPPRLHLGSKLRAGPAVVRATETTTPHEHARATSRSAPCTAEQNATIATAVDLSRKQISWVQNYVDNGCVDTGYTAWFGNYTPANYATVKSCVTSIDQLLHGTNGLNFTVVCEPDCHGIYAYVWTTDPNKNIHVCDVFFGAGTGWPEEDTTGGTLIHECSHFADICGTADHVYGSGDARWLATNDTSEAINNADSYEYFAENKPAICAVTTTPIVTTLPASSTSQSTTFSSSSQATTASQSTISQSSSSQSTSSQPSSSQSTSSQSSSSQSTSTRSSGSQSTTSQSSGSQSTTSQPSGSQSTSTRSSGVQSTTSQSSGSQSTTTRSSGSQSTTSQSSGSQSTTSQSSGSQSTTSQSSGCFAVSGSVRVLTGDETVVLKSLSEIQVGDLVESVDASLKREFSQVYAVLHKDATKEETILQLNVEGSSIKLTAHHLLLVSSSSASSVDWQLAAAASVRTGDRLLVITEDGSAVARLVLSIQQLKQAIRAPLTLNDRIVVDGVVASVFAHSESLYSPLCAPLKFVFQHFPNLLASSPAQAILNLIVQWTDSFEARQALQLSSFAR